MWKDGPWFNPTSQCGLGDESSAAYTFVRSDTRPKAITVEQRGMERSSHRRAWIGGWFALAVMWNAPAIDARDAVPSSAALATFRQQQTQLRWEFEKKLKSLDAWCGERNLPEAQRELQAALAVDAIAKESGSLHPDLPSARQPEPPIDLPADERYWRMQLRTERKQYAKDVYLLSRRALHGGFPGFAFDLVKLAALHDSDHPAARRVLGYTLFEGRWVRPFEAEMSRKRFVLHEEFGWLPQAHTERYERGERIVDGRWVSAAQEREIRRDFRKAWEVRTEHYLVRTNHSQEHGARIGRQLENFYEQFHEIFASFFNTPEQIQQLFDGAGPVKTQSTKPYLVHVYRTRDEYVERLRKQISGVEITNGLYVPQQRTAHFYFDADAASPDTLYHEATHQLLYESHPAERTIGQNARFWILEGIACYMESFHKADSGVSLGDAQHVRFRDARHNVLVEKYYLPLAEFDALGQAAFQKHPRISENYAQASGLARFFMHAGEGRYRDALVRQLASMYSPNARTRDQTPSLAELIGVDSEQLDREYQAYLRDQQLSIDNPPPK